MEYENDNLVIFVHSWIVDSTGPPKKIQYPPEPLTDEEYRFVFRAAGDLLEIRDMYNSKCLAALQVARRFAGLEEAYEPRPESWEGLLASNYDLKPEDFKAFHGNAPEDDQAHLRRGLDRIDQDLKWRLPPEYLSSIDHRTEQQTPVTGDRVLIRPLIERFKAACEAKELELGQTIHNGLLFEICSEIKIPNLPEYEAFKHGHPAYTLAREYASRLGYKRKRRGPPPTERSEDNSALK